MRAKAKSLREKERKREKKKKKKKKTIFGIESLTFPILVPLELFD